MIRDLILALAVLGLVFIHWETVEAMRDIRRVIETPFKALPVSITLEAGQVPSEAFQAIQPPFAGRHDRNQSKGTPK